MARRSGRVRIAGMGKLAERLSRVGNAIPDAIQGVMDDTAEHAVVGLIHLTEPQRHARGRHQTERALRPFLAALRMSGDLDDVVLPDRFSSYEVAYPAGPVELNLHGDVGLGGSRGSPRSFVRAAPKVISGHRHTPYRREWHGFAGTSTISTCATTEASSLGARVFHPLPEWALDARFRNEWSFRPESLETL